jgi:thymidylate kinase
MMGSSRKAARSSGAAASEIGLFSDRMESRGLEFRRKVRQGYLDQVAADPGRYLLIDARGEEGAVFKLLLSGLEQFASTK